MFGWTDADAVRNLISRIDVTLLTPDSEDVLDSLKWEMLSEICTKMDRFLKEHTINEYSIKKYLKVKVMVEQAYYYLNNHKKTVGIGRCWVCGKLDFTNKIHHTYSNHWFHEKCRKEYKGEQE